MSGKKLALVCLLTVANHANALSVAVASRGGVYSNHRYEELCAMIPACVEKEAAEKAKREEASRQRALELATPSQKRPPIPEWEEMQKRLRGVKLLKRKEFEK